jgi:Holliday junction resolvase RusA-like endonuclease
MSSVRGTMFAYFKVNLEPVTSNRSHYRFSKNLTERARKYREAFWSELNKGANLNALKRIRGEFDPNKHELRVKYVFHLVKDKFFTKKGMISARSPDLDNCIKLIQDFLFNKRYAKKHLDKLGFCNIEIDDRFITEINMKKVPTNEEPFIEIQVEIHPLKFVNN